MYDFTFHTGSAALFLAHNFVDMKAEMSKPMRAIHFTVCENDKVRISSVKGRGAGSFLQEYTEATDLQEGKSFALVFTKEQVTLLKKIAVQNKGVIISVNEKEAYADIVCSLFAIQVTCMKSNCRFGEVYDKFVPIEQGHNAIPFVDVKRFDFSNILKNITYPIIVNGEIIVNDEIIVNGERECNLVLFDAKLSMPFEFIGIVRSIKEKDYDTTNFEAPAWAKI